MSKGLSRVALLKVTRPVKVLWEWPPNIGTTGE